MRLYRCQFIFFLISTLTSLSVFSASDIRITHSLLSHEKIDNATQICLNLVVNNDGFNNYRKLQIQSLGNEYVDTETQKVLVIDNLPSMGQSVIQFTADSTRTETYFQSGLPLFFLITAKHEDGETIEIPVYSIWQEIK